MKAVVKMVGKRTLYFFSGWVVLLGGVMVAKLANDTVTEAEVLNTISTSMNSSMVINGVYAVIILVALVWAIWFWRRAYTGR